MRFANGAQTKLNAAAQAGGTTNATTLVVGEDLRVNLTDMTLTFGNEVGLAHLPSHCVVCGSRFGLPPFPCRSRCPCRCAATTPRAWR